ncbi:dUTP diphosphatase [Bacillus sp. FJAT-29790]|uniref:dUTP diphosphatase n=1 Tax=Bacillus sp. FJAT-29790 TaxID=1895002 RepID=UPI001C23DBBB|nr:dUTP diphosphatase [Bacillus sp. FJAT-29790]MBU8879654.1 dUTP diphosphatase [Bacillus sp. FJAT-29790]
MNYRKLFDMQTGLDQHIETKHQLQAEDLFDRKVLALLVELGELANETRCFKFWSLKPSSPKETVLEEFVDGVHFILSLGIECGFDQENNYSVDLLKKESATEQFLFVFEQISKFRTSRSMEDYKKLFQAYLDLGELLGFNAEETEKAYMDKNEVNYQRQQDGY